MTMNNNVLNEKLHSISRGRRLWKKYRKKYKIDDNTAFVMMPSEDKEVNIYGSTYLNSFMKAHGFGQAVVVAGNDQAAKTVGMLGINVKDIKRISEKEMQDLVAYYCACNPDRRFVVVDIDNLTARRQIRHLVGINDITIEKIVAVGIYHLVPFEKVDVPLFGFDK